MTAVPLRHVAEVRTSSVDKHAHEGEAPVQLCNYVDVYKNDKVGPGPHLMRATATSDEVSRFHLELGDSVLTKDSEDPKDIGISAYVDATADDFVCGYHLAIARPLDGTHPRYLTWALRSRPVLDHFTNHSSGISRYGLTTAGLRAAPVPWQELEQQRRIADFLDDRVARIDQIITARKTQITATEGRFEAWRRNAVLGLSAETHATDLPWAAHVGVGWHVRRLSHVARMGTGHTPSRSEPGYWIDCEIPWITTSDVHRFRRDEIDRIDDTEIQISHAGLSNSAAVLHPAGTVALSRTASAGFSIVMNRDMATSQDFVTWSCRPELRPDFLLHTLRVMRPYLLGYLAMGSTHKTIYFPDLMDIQVPLPSLAQQDQVIGHVRVAADERASLSTAMERQIEMLQVYKQSLITAAVTGEIDVTTAGSGIQG